MAHKDVSISIALAVTQPQKIVNPNIARFLQADPFIQDTDNSQSYNRYSYVLNNPLNFTDPSGYLSFGSIYGNFLELSGLASVHRFLIRNPALNTLAQIAIIASTGPWAAEALAHFSFDQTYVATGSTNRAFRTGAIVLGASYAAGAVGANTNPGDFGNILGNALVGGITAELQGGNFGHAFWSAGFAAAVKPMLNDIGGNQSANAAVKAGDLDMLAIHKTDRIIGAALIGGTASKISGGKFANGAITAAFVQAFNGDKSSANAIKSKRTISAKLLTVRQGIDHSTITII